MRLHESIPGNIRLLALAGLFAFHGIADPVNAQNREADVAAINRVLDGVHDAADKGDFERYFSLFAEGGVFLGTDATERWPIEEFKAYSKPHFEDGHGWTYTVDERHVDFTPDGNSAWFDELLTNANLGTCRGSGILVRVGDRWKVAQYNLTIPIPNELASQVVGLVREASADDM